MKKLIMPLTLISMALLQTACSGGGSSSDASTAKNQLAMACNGDPTCMSQVSAKAAALNEVAPAGTSGSALTAFLGTKTNPANLQVASVTPAASDAAIKAQAIKVQSALDSYAKNPDSSYYEPSTAARTPAAATDVAPASVTIAQPVQQSVVESSLNASAGGTSEGVR